MWGTTLRGFRCLPLPVASTRIRSSQLSMDAAQREARQGDGSATSSRGVRAPSAGSQAFLHPVPHTKSQPVTRAVPLKRQQVPATAGSSKVPHSSSSLRAMAGMDGDASRSLEPESPEHRAQGIPTQQESSPESAEVTSAMMTNGLPGVALLCGASWDPDEQLVVLQRSSILVSCFLYLCLIVRVGFHRGFFRGVPGQRGVQEPSDLRLALGSTVGAPGAAPVMAAFFCRFSEVFGPL